MVVVDLIPLNALLPTLLFVRYPVLKMTVFSLPVLYSAYFHILFSFVETTLNFVIPLHSLNAPLLIVVRFFEEI